MTNHIIINETYIPFRLRVEVVVVPPAEVFPTSEVVVVVILLLLIPDEDALWLLLLLPWLERVPVVEGEVKRLPREFGERLRESRSRWSVGDIRPVARNNNNDDR